jgi:hypothetical protein
MRIVVDRTQLNSAVLLLLIGLSSGTAVWSLPTEQISTSDEGRANVKAVVKYLWPALRSSARVARLYYRSNCWGSDDSAVSFPRIDVQPPQSKSSGINAVRDIFRGHKDIAITQDAKGIIRIKFGEVPDEILRTRISSLRLDPLSQYNATLAIAAIESTQEVQFAMHKFGLKIPQQVYNMLLVKPAEGLVHLPAEIRNVSMDQALDLVATVFRGIVIYGACANSNLYDVTITGGIYFDDSAL